MSTDLREPKRSWPMLGAIACVLVIGTLLRLAHVNDVGQRTPDEGAYTAQAATLLARGAAGTRDLSEKYLADLQRALPPPTRIGYTGAVAFLMELTGRRDPSVGAWVSTIASLISLVLVAAIARRTFGDRIALVALCFYATFPPALVVARRAWADAWVECLTLFTIFLALDAMRGRPWRSYAVPVCVAVTLLLLSKEIAVVVVSLVLVSVLFAQGRNAWPFVAAVLGAGLLALSIEITAVGDWESLWRIVSTQARFHAANPYTIEFQSGPFWWIGLAFWIVAPAVFLLAATAALFLCVGGNKSVRRELAVLVVFFYVFLCLPILLPGWLNLRFFSPIYGVTCIMAALTLDGLLRVRARAESASTRAQTLVCAGVIAAVLFVDMRYFRIWFVERQTADLSIKMLFATQHASEIAPRTHSAASPAAAAAAISTNDSLRLAAEALAQSLTLYQARRFAESIAAAQRAISLDPSLAEAHNNMAAAYAELGRWDESIAAAKVAIELKPDFQLAKNNLAWARSECSKLKRCQ